MSRQTKRIVKDKQDGKDDIKDTNKTPIMYTILKQHLTGHKILTQESNQLCVSNTDLLENDANESKYYVIGQSGIWLAVPM